jgi:membrane-bound lytic murein transglycosylase D
MEKVFRAERLPIELTRLPFVESSFNVQARSRVGASGVWQFMPRTAKPSMMVNRDVDERNDPATATHAAARLMRANFEMLRSWPLALTAYNHGAAGVARAVRKAKSRELSVIIDNYSSRRFGFASSNFFACFLAALEVEKQARTMLGDVKWSLEFDGAEVDVVKPFSWKTLVDFYDGESPLAELQNPHLTIRVRSKGKAIPKGTFVRVPTSRLELAKDFVAGRITEDALHAKLAITPIPRMTTAEGREGSLRSKIGAVSEAAKALLPFISASPARPVAPSATPAGK